MACETFCRNNNNNNRVHCEFNTAADEVTSAAHQVSMECLLRTCQGNTSSKHSSNCRCRCRGWRSRNAAALQLHIRHPAAACLYPASARSNHSCQQLFNFIITTAIATNAGSSITKTTTTATTLMRNNLSCHYSSFAKRQMLQGHTKWQSLPHGGTDYLHCTVFGHHPKAAVMNVARTHNRLCVWCCCFHDTHMRHAHRRICVLCVLCVACILVLFVIYNLILQPQPTQTRCWHVELLRAVKVNQKLPHKLAAHQSTTLPATGSL